MNFDDPVIVFSGESDIDPFRVRSHLLQNGVEAEVIEVADRSAGDVFGGSLSEPPPPQLVVEKTQYDKARAMVVEFEQQFKLHREQERERLSKAEPIPVECEKCAKVTEFPAIQKGTVQVCPKCQAYVDVGDEDAFDDWQIEDPDPET